VNLLTFILPERSTFNMSYFRGSLRIGRIEEANSKVDRAWEKMLEISLFAIDNTHRKSVDVLKGFISEKPFAGMKLSQKAKNNLKNTFDFIKEAQGEIDNKSALFTEYTYFYTLITLLLRNSLPKKTNAKAYKSKIIQLDAIISGTAKPTTSIRKLLKEFRPLTLLGTTDVTNRQRREQLMMNMIKEV
jgi:hypothetical protein